VGTRLLRAAFQREQVAQAQERRRLQRRLGDMACQLGGPFQRRPVIVDRQ
jgi:hypothetical protein